MIVILRLTNHRRSYVLAQTLWLYSVVVIIKIKFNKIFCWIIYFNTICSQSIFRYLHQRVTTPIHPIGVVTQDIINVRKGKNLNQSQSNPRGLMIRNNMIKNYTVEFIPYLIYIFVFVSEYICITPCLHERTSERVCALKCVHIFECLNIPKLLRLFSYQNRARKTFQLNFAI